MIVVIPDVHGRTFWKDVVKKYENEDIIFLGDYVDPYTFEGITKQDALDNLKELMDFVKTHDNVTLLLGNHDLTYLNDKMSKDRYDYTGAKEIKQLFNDNLDRFKFIVFRTIDNKKVSFSHSVIGKHWLETCKKLKDKNSDEVAELLNNDINNHFLYIEEYAKVGYSRGGWYPYGSIVWADVCEANPVNENTLDDIDYMVFGHTQQRDEPIITDTYACLDVRKGFIIDNYLSIKPI